MKKVKTNWIEYIENNTIRCEASGRGGGIEIDLGELLGEGKKMSAYQNYLGGGMLGAIQSNCNFEPANFMEGEMVKEIAEALKKYFHNLTNHEGDEWEEQSYKQNQNMPVSGY